MTINKTYRGERRNTMRDNMKATFTLAMWLILAAAIFISGHARASERFVCTGAGPCVCWVATAKKSIRPDGLVSVVCVNTRLATRNFYDDVDMTEWKAMGESDTGAQK
jgi:hypothetical protein